MSFNITNGLQRAGLVLNAVGGLVPLLGSLITSAESLFPNAGSGASKLAYVQGIIKDALVFSGTAIVDVESMIPAVTSIINNIVAAAKAPLPAVAAPVVAAPVIAPVAP